MLKEKRKKWMLFLGCLVFLFLVGVVNLNFIGLTKNFAYIDYHFQSFYAPYISFVA